MTRSRWIPIVVVALTGLLALMAVGCSDQTDEANALIDTANASIESANKLDAEMSQLMDQASTIDPTGKNAADAKPLLDQIAAKLAETKKANEAAVAAMDKAAALDVSEEFKTYIGQQKEIATLQTEGTGLVEDLLSKLTVMYDPARMAKMTPAQVDTLIAEADAISVQLQELDAKVAEKGLASDRYFGEQGLGK